MKQPLTDVQLNTLVVLQDLHRELTTWPPQRYVAERLGCSVANVSMLVKKLVRHGWLLKIGNGAYRFVRDEVKA